MILDLSDNIDMLNSSKEKFSICLTKKQMSNFETHISKAHPEDAVSIRGKLYWITSFQPFYEMEEELYCVTVRVKEISNEEILAIHAHDLQVVMENMVLKEDYEAAAKIRDLINTLK